MFIYMLSSIDTHADKGFGVTAESFKKAADHLSNSDFKEGMLVQGEMPVLYLYRHSIELFLKSLIMHIHEEVSIPYMNVTASGNHQFMVNDKGTPLYIENCHSLKLLFEYLCKLIKENEDRLKMQAPNASWLITGRIRGYMKSIYELDDKSDYFRYPISRDQSKDKAKYTMKRIKDKDLRRVTNNVEGKVILATKNRNGDIQNIYMRDENILKEITTALTETAEYFSGFHIMTRMELCNGW
ncbi:hypothetical protein SD70_24785 [Gordoniibacillus kamchatkensis]|uniref:Uncharacterized protein n=1 Tax=Gordoniibacillus kamchatkensis TaxID=1590651 RepID=A0ABR5ACA3_9BACL|nr:hypothetical protein [Paenibacillus sp. VKM B-2647]KIL38671.1 hypothetical protein SD70_24785 [Paenibacillus sp. VKM B-2647]